MDSHGCSINEVKCMRKFFKLLICVCALLICTSRVMALEFAALVEHLPASSDYQAVQESAEEIIDMINALVPEDQAIDRSNVAWDGVFKIYVDDMDIFALSSFSKKDIINNMKYIWCYPATIDGRFIRVTISKAVMPDHALVDQGIISEEMYEDFADKAGTWCAPEAEIDTKQSPENIIASLEDAGINEQNDVILVGGTPKMRTLFAVTFVDGYADKLIPLARTGSVLNTGINTVSDYEEGGSELAVGTAYNFSEIAQAMNGASLPDSEAQNGGSAIQNQVINFRPLLCAFIVLAVSIVTYILCFRRQKHSSD